MPIDSITVFESGINPLGSCGNNSCIVEGSSGFNSCNSPTAGVSVSVNREVSLSEGLSKFVVSETVGCHSKESKGRNSESFHEICINYGVCEFIFILKQNHKAYIVEKYI